MGTNIYLFTNPTLSGTDAAPSAFTNLFSTAGNLTSAALSSAQSMFAITYMNANYITSYSARLMTSSSQSATLTAYFTTPSYTSSNKVLTLNNVQLVGGVGSIYFVLVLYKQISVNLTTKASTVNVRMNKAPTTEQVLNCLNWMGETAEGCGRAVYTGVAPLSVVFTQVEPNALYMLYYVVASEFPMRPIVGSLVSSTTVVTYLHEMLKYYTLALLIIFLMI